MPPNKMPQYFGKDLEVMSFARNYHKWILAEFLPYIGKSVAEVGAGVGNFDPNPGNQHEQLESFRAISEYVPFYYEKLLARTNEPKRLTTSLAEQITENVLIQSCMSMFLNI